MRTQSVDTDPKIERLQIAGLRKMTPARRLELAVGMTRTVRQLSWAGLCERYPDATEEELRYRWCSLIYGKELADRYIEGWRAREERHSQQQAID